MTPLIATVAGVFSLGGAPLHRSGRVSHLVRSGGGWWAVGDEGLLHDGAVVAPPPAGTALHCVAASADRVWVGADSARLLWLDEEKLVQDEAFARAPGRDSWHTPWGGPPDVRSLSVGADGTLYVNVHVGGILRQMDGGFSPTVDIHSDVHQVLAHPDRPGVVAAATARGLAISRHGSEFVFRTDGLHHPYCRAVALDGEAVLVSASRGPRGGEARLYRGRLDGGELRPCSGLGAFRGNLDTHRVLALPGAYLLGHGPTVWSSTDGGDTWEVAADGLPTITALA